jgi:hypothetical protein
MFEELLQFGRSTQSIDNCWGLSIICGPAHDGLITLGVLVGVASAGLVLFRRLRKPVEAINLK